jgi:hypothetical protein
MKKLIYLSLLAFLVVLGCSKSEDDLTVKPDDSLLKSARTASPIAQWTKPAIWDNNSVLQTALWFPPPAGSTLPNYSFAQFPLYDFSPYFMNGETQYNPANYDVMTHFGYFSPEDLKNAVVEFTFPHIEYFLPHMNNINQQRIYTVNNEGNQTVITCITDLKKAYWNTATPPVLIGTPMFCFLVKVDCGSGNSGLTTFWTDMKVNGVSVKGTIKNKVFACD